MCIQYLVYSSTFTYIHICTYMYVIWSEVHQRNLRLLKLSRGSIFRLWLPRLPTTDTMVSVQLYTIEDLPFCSMKYVSVYCPTPTPPHPTPIRGRNPKSSHGMLHCVLSIRWLWYIYRTAVNAQSGVKTPAAGIVTGNDSLYNVHNRSKLYSVAAGNYLMNQ